MDISKDSDQLLREMRSKTRYNSRLSERKGVRFTDAHFNRLDEWYRMYTEIHLLMAEKDHTPLAGMILALHGTTATYLYGASRGEQRNLMPTLPAVCRPGTDRHCLSPPLSGKALE